MLFYLRRSVGKVPHGSAGLFSCLLLGRGEEGVEGLVEDLAEGDQLDVGDETLTGLNPLDGVFVHVQADQLEAVGQLPLGNFQFFPEGGYVCAADVVSVIGRLIDEQNSPPFDI